MGTLLSHLLHLVVSGLEKRKWKVSTSTLWAQRTKAMCIVSGLRLAPVCRGTSNA
jgi:hypothetical protein